jgi:hypothetical protein
MAKRDQFTPKPDLILGRYQHYKGDLYQVLDLACNSETLEWYVVYKRLYEDMKKPELWVRPYKMFAEAIEVNGKDIPRFKKIDELGLYSSDNY